MSKRETKRQHYVPRTYLKHFSTERSKEFYIKALPINDFRNESIIEMSINNVCLQKDIYTLEGDSEKERMLIENFYRDEVEKHYDQIYQILIDPSKKILTEKERELIISTVVTMFYRTTKWVSQHYETVNRVVEHMFQLCKQTGTDYYMSEGKKISIAGKTLEEHKNEIKAENKPFQVLTQLEAALKLKELRKLKDGIFISKLIDDDCEFITSDNPVCYNNVNNKYVMPFDPTNLLSLPLDSKHKLILMPYSSSETKNMIVRSNLSGTMCFGQKLSSNYDQFKNSERFMLGTDSGLKSYLSTKEFTEKPIIKDGNYDLSGGHANQ